MVGCVESLEWRPILQTVFLGLLVAGFSTGSCIENEFPQDDERLFDTEFPWIPDTPDRDGLNRDTRYFLGYQLVAIGILYAMPENVTGWSDEQKSSYSMSDWWDNVTHPGRDTDDFFINYVMHPYWGAAYYVRASERGYDRRDAFWYSVLLSTLYEFGAEALFEEPSIQDLIVTPTIGSLVGGFFMGVRNDLRTQSMSRGHRTSREKWVMVFTDPLGALNRGVDRLVGRKTELQVYPYFYMMQPVDDPFAMATEWERVPVTGLGFQVSW